MAEQVLNPYIARLIEEARTDERKQADAEYAVDWAHRNDYLRAKIKALTPIGVVYPHGLDVLVPRTLIDRADVLALLDGATDE